jgi:hypothetical protein
VNPDTGNKLPAKTDDKSGIGVRYVDACIKPMSTPPGDGTAVRCKRRGLKIVLSAGAKNGEELIPLPIISGHSHMRLLLFSE